MMTIAVEGINMKPQSGKHKGRRLQQWVRDRAKEEFGFTEDDCRSTSMGVSGEDVQFSSEARKRFPVAIECKNTEKVNMWEAYDQAITHSKKVGGIPVVFIKKNHREPVAVLDGKVFIQLMANSQKDK